MDALGQLLIVFFGYLFHSCASAFKDIPPPRFQVDLDAPATERWGHVVKNYADMYPIMEKEFYKILPKKVVDFATEIVGELDKYLPAPYADEIRGVANYTNSTVGFTLLGNLAYDFSAFHHSKKNSTNPGACTSIIAMASNGTLFHGRNLDYSFHNLLRNFTVVIDFRKNGNTVFTGTTFAGYIGILTGMRPNGISISLNERNTGEWWENMFSAAKTRLHGLVGLVIREVLEDTTMEYAQVVATLSSRELIAPCFLIVGGLKPFEGAVITRDRLKARDVWHLNETVEHWYILETNYDHWEAPPSSDDRRDPAIQAMKKVGQEHLDVHTLYGVLSIPPILNNSTAYTTIMSAQSPSIYHTMIRLP